ncbi:MAG: hypothetical protein WB609_10340 [Candidatus Cybelea sp.]
MIVKLVRTIARGDEFLLVEGGDETVADAYLSKGWIILGVFRGGTPDEVSFVLQQDQIAAAAEMIEGAETINTSLLSDFS